MLIDTYSVGMQYVNVAMLKDKTIYLPIFQRGYSWTEKQIEQLLVELKECIYHRDKQLYLLDFIWFEEDGCFKLADGQQRIVTLNILTKCINDIIDLKNLNIDKLELYEIKYDNDDNQKKYDKFLNSYVVSPYKKVYLRIKEYLEENITQLEDIIYSLNNQIYVYLKQTSSVDDAFEIFKQINTGGKPLSKDDIIKTVLSQYANRYQIELKGNLKDIKKLITSYNKLIAKASVGNFDNIAIMSFLNHNIIDTKEHFQIFVNYLNIVKNVNKQAVYHIITYLNRGQLIDIIYILGIKNINPEINRDYLDKILLPLCLLSVVMTIKKVNPGGIILTLYSSIIEMIKNDEMPDLIQNHILNFVSINKEICKISYDEFEDSLGKRELSQNIKKAILIMDIVRRNTSGSLNVEKINLEHIYPQKPQTSWGLHGWPVERNEQLELINNIGNYILLNEEVNKKIKNKYIDDKLIEYNRIIPHDLILQTAMNTVDFSRFKNEKGNYIKDRQKQIAKMLYNDFPFGMALITF